MPLLRPLDVYGTHIIIGVKNSETIEHLENIMLKNQRAFNENT